MAKQGEIDYIAKIGPSGAAHAQGKPFSDPGCGGMLVDIGSLFMVLPAPPARVLDLGCGSGWTSALLARRGYQVVGQDIAPDMIALARGNLAAVGAGSLEFVVSDYESLTFRDEFDAALFYDALHHAQDPLAALAGAYRALKLGGMLVTLEPGSGHAHTEAAKHAVSQYDVTERDMPPRTVVALAREVGFRSARVHPMPKSLASIQYQLPRLERWPAWLSDLARWCGAGWLGLIARRRRGGMVVLRK
ncbi:MAG: class I SAM-dependent methyltransferase [Rhodanobacteraceae bacterium]